ncbi:hypothetical protein CU098_011176, partial [Rhizopus stolonifer]
MKNDGEVFYEENIDEENNEKKMLKNFVKCIFDLNSAAVIPLMVRLGLPKKRDK